MNPDFPYAGKLLEFYATSGRSLPWRDHRDPYRIWVAEIMLQQTQVTTVRGYYDRFLTKFPTVCELARADVQEVRAQWQGLGYYRRAEHLHRAARIIQNDLDQHFPDTLEGWMALPGVGRSTAGAILAIGWNQRHPILDGNCKRVLARLVALDEPVNSSQGEGILWSLAALLTPERCPGDYAQAIMDLGATVCTPHAPHCPECPWRMGCRALAEGRVDQYPRKKPPRGCPKYSQVAFLVRAKDGRILMHRRPEGGLLSGLWEPLSLERQIFSLVPPGVAEVDEQLWQHWQIKCREMNPVGTVQHRFTHFHLTVWVFACHHESGWPQGDGVCWWHPGQTDLPISTLHSKVIMIKK